MSTGNKITISEWKLEDHSTEVLKATKEQIANALESCGQACEGHAKLVCPVDTGRLRNSITHTVNGDAAYIGSNVEYAGFVEQGTYKQRAQPYLRPAVSDHTSEYESLIKTALSK